MKSQCWPYSNWNITRYDFDITRDKEITFISETQDQLGKWWMYVKGRIVYGMAGGMAHEIDINRQSSNFFRDFWPFLSCLDLFNRKFISDFNHWGGGCPSFRCATGLYLTFFAENSLAFRCNGEQKSFPIIMTRSISLSISLNV